MHAKKKKKKPFILLSLHPELDVRYGVIHHVVKLVYDEYSENQ